MSYDLNQYEFKRLVVLLLLNQNKMHMAILVIDNTNAFILQIYWKRILIYMYRHKINEILDQGKRPHLLPPSFNINVI